MIEDKQKTPSFLGTKVEGEIPFAEIEPLIDREMLFCQQWQFRKNQTPDAWQAFKAEKVLPIFERILGICHARQVMQPAVVYGHFACERIGNGLLVKDARREYRFDFPRERKSPNRCLSDLFPDGFVTFQIATVGSRVAEIAADCFKKNNYSDAFYLKGLAAVAAEACALWSHERIREELGVASDVGARFSPGYPAFPDLLAQKQIVSLLDAARIGVALTETCHFIPEYTTSAIISIDKGAQHFRP